MGGRPVIGRLFQSLLRFSFLFKSCGLWPPSGHFARPSQLMKSSNKLRSLSIVNENQQHKLCLTRVGLRDRMRSGLPYWEVQVGLLTPFTFTRHRLSPFAVLLPVRTFFTIAFFTIKGTNSYFVKFTVPKLKGSFEGLSGNKQERLARATACQITQFSTHS